MTEGPTTERPGQFVKLGWRSVAIASAVAATGTLALIVLNDPAQPSPRYTIGDSPEQYTGRDADPLRAELARCRTLPANSDDARCREAWEVNRRRFMGESRSYVAPAEPTKIESGGIEPAPSSSAEQPGVAAPATPAIPEH